MLISVIPSLARHPATQPASPYIFLPPPLSTSCMTRFPKQRRVVRRSLKKKTVSIVPAAAESSSRKQQYYYPPAEAAAAAAALGLVCVCSTQQFRLWPEGSLPAWQARDSAAFTSFLSENWILCRSAPQCVCDSLGSASGPHCQTHSKRITTATKHAFNLHILPWRF